MRAISSIASITAHVGVGAALLLGSTTVRRSGLARPVEISVVLPAFPTTTREAGGWAPVGPNTVSIDLATVRLPDFAGGGGATATTFPIATASGAPSAGSSESQGLAVLGSESGPEVLTGPLPLYPELLRQARIQGRVVLEAIIDTTGRVWRDSIVVVAATHPEFVASARRALLATLFRPAFVAGRAVRVRVRIPFEFTIQDGRVAR